MIAPKSKPILLNYAVDAIRSALSQIDQIQQSIKESAPSVMLRGPIAYSQISEMLVAVSAQLEKAWQEERKLDDRLHAVIRATPLEVIEIQKRLLWVVSGAFYTHYKSVMLMMDESIHQHETTHSTLEQAHDELIAARTAIRVMCELFCLYSIIQTDCDGAYDLKNWRLREKELPQQIADCFLVEEIESGLDDEGEQ